MIDYFPDQKKVFLTKLFSGLKAEGSFSSDLKISQLMQEYESDLEFVAVDQPWRLPLCLQCELKCPGYENCKVEHIQWFWNYYRTLQTQKKETKIFTPYTQRAVESVLLSQLEQPFMMSHAMGANSAPLLARAAFLKRRSQANWIEVFPPLSVWRIGRHLNMKRSDLRSYRKSAVGESCRRQILSHLQKHDVVFLYKEDVQMMIQSVHAFDAFISAYTAFLKATQQTESRPANFPAQEDWIEFPKEALQI